jgi:hypothetical protein
MNIKMNLKNDSFTAMFTRVAVCLALFGSVRDVFANDPSWWLRAEIGSTWTGFNYFQIPNDDMGSRVDLPENKSFNGYRISGKVNVSDAWELRGLYAPLTTSYRFTPAEDVQFDGKTFEANESVRTTYKFNSYRISLVRRWVSGQSVWRAGFTAKVRDANIRLENSSKSEEYPNVGFVPLVFLGWDYAFSDRFGLSLDMDGLAGGPGRAFDVKSELQVMPGSWAIGLGYRLLDGGANNKKVKNFALLHTAFVSAEWRGF